MEKMSLSKFISLGSILSTIAILFQSAPLFIPAVGLTLSPFSTLPIAIAAVVNVSLGVTVFFTSALLLSIISLQETMIFLFTTGLLGMVMGSLIYRKAKTVSILFSSIALLIGMIFLNYFIKIAGFVEFTNSFTTSQVIPIFLGFSIVYAFFWNIGFSKFTKYLQKINLLH